MAKKDEKRWLRLNQCLLNYQCYLERKSDNSITYIDLLYVSNFKGGNASLTDPIDEVNSKLVPITIIIERIKAEFGQKSIEILTDQEVEVIHSILEELDKLLMEPSSQISGFKISYLSALLHANFPRLFPILDRRILINSGIVNKSNLSKNKQVKYINKYYILLFNWFRSEVKNTNKTIREIDRILFSTSLRI